jgi:hypothetical protein
MLIQTLDDIENWRAGGLATEKTPAGARARQRAD